MEDFVHLESGEDGLNQNSSADGRTAYAQFVLREAENIVPQTRFQMALHLGQVKVWPGSFADQLLRVVEEVEAEVEERTGNRLAVHTEMSFIQMPTAWTHHQRRHMRIEFVALALWTDIAD